jgi:hypothetical protein
VRTSAKLMTIFITASNIKFKQKSAEFRERNLSAGTTTAHNTAPPAVAALSHWLLATKPSSPEELSCDLFKARSTINVPEWIEGDVLLDLRARDGRSLCYAERIVKRPVGSRDRGSLVQTLLMGHYTIFLLNYNSTFKICSHLTTQIPTLNYKCIILVRLM